MNKYEQRQAIADKYGIGELPKGGLIAICIAMNGHINGSSDLLSQATELTYQEVLANALTNWDTQKHSHIADYDDAVYALCNSIVNHFVYN